MPRQGKLNFLFSACLAEEDSIVSVALPPVICNFLDVFFERFDGITTALGDLVLH